MENTLFLFADTDSSVTTEALLARLTPQRLDKACLYKKEIDRRICAWSEILLFYALRAVGAPPICVSWDGKPRLSDEKYHFSLSHTQNQIALLIASVPCGTDIEIPRPLKQKKALCSRLFTEKEQVVLCTDEDFFRMWTAKEAFVKYTGEGFSRPFSSFYIDFEKGVLYDVGTNIKMAYITPFTAFEKTVGCICANVPLEFKCHTVTAEDIM